jgi:hypothetical protein
VKANRISIIDADVFDHNSKNVALPKDDFAEAVASDDSLKGVDHSSFSLVFDIFDRIIKHASSRNVLTNRHWRPDRGGNAKDTQLPGNAGLAETSPLSQ